MLTEKIKFRDLEGIEKIHTLYFNLNEAEITEWETEIQGGLQKALEVARDSVDNYALLMFMKALLRKSYGVKSADNTRIDKSDEISRNFENSVYYSDFLFSLFENDGARAQKFINSVMPADLIRRAAAQNSGEKIGREDLTPKERWDIRQRENANKDPEIVDFTSFGDEDVQEAYSAPVQVSAPENPAPPVQHTPPQPESSDELEEFRRWKAQNVSTQPAEQTIGEEAGWTRPPHESGPGLQFNQD